MIKVSHLVGGSTQNNSKNDISKKEFHINNVMTSAESLTDESKIGKMLEKKVHLLETMKRKRIREKFKNESKLELCTEVEVKEPVVIDALREKKDALSIDNDTGVKSHLPKKKRVSIVETNFAPSEENILCSACTKVFCSRENFECHPCSELWTCFQCNKTLQKTSRRQHEAIHSKEKKYICGICKKKFFQQGNLTTHIQNCHTENSILYYCDVEGCKRVSPFKHEYDLRQHKRIHMEENPFSCSEPGCGIRFNQKNNLLIHIRCVHEGQKFECPVEGCGKYTNTSNVRKYHQKCFRTMHALKYHQVEYHPTEENIKDLLAFHEREGRWPMDDKKVDLDASVRLLRRMMEHLKDLNKWSSDEDCFRLIKSALD